MSSQRTERTKRTDPRLLDSAASLFPPPHAASPSVTFFSKGRRRVNRQVGRKCGPQRPERPNSSQAGDQTSYGKESTGLL
jgi:hypothetical protein